MEPLERDLSSALPYPKLMRDVRDHKNIIFALDDETIVILVHPNHEFGKLMHRVRVTKFFDYDGVIYPNWLEVMGSYCNVETVGHFRKYYSEQHRADVRKRETTRRKINFELTSSKTDYTTYTEGHTWDSPHRL